MYALIVAPAHAQVHVDIGIHLPAPPKLIIVPQVPEVRYVPAPAAPVNLSPTGAGTSARGTTARGWSLVRSSCPGPS
jgi:hypothetical protein